jgi:hypothetical protein
MTDREENDVKQQMLRDFLRFSRARQESICQKIGLAAVETGEAVFQRAYNHAKETGQRRYLYQIILEAGHRSRESPNPFEK